MMKRNVLVMGDRTLSGDLGRVIVCGNAEINDARVASLIVAGNADVSQSAIRKMKVAGQVNAKKSSFQTVLIRGEMDLKSECTADNIDLGGELNAEYLVCKTITCKGMQNRNEPTSIYGYVKADRLEINEGLRLEGNSSFQTVVNYGSLMAEDGIECDSFFGFGSVSAPQINGDQVYLYTGGESFVELITGTKITLASHWAPGKNQRDIKPPEQVLDTANRILSVGQIEGDSICVDHVKAESISGIDIKIGDLCVIDRVEYSGNLTVSPKAVVLETIKQ